MEKESQPISLNLDLEYRFSAPPVNKSPLDYFRLFQKPEIINHLISETNRYSVEKNGFSINCTFKEMEVFIGILLTMGVAKLPGHQLYWNPHFRLAPMADCKGLTRYETLSRYFHISDNNYMKQRGDIGYDPLFKIRPLLHPITNDGPIYLQMGTSAASPCPPTRLGNKERITLTGLKKFFCS